VFSDSGMLERMKLKKEIAYIQLQIIQKRSEIQKFREMTDKRNLDNILFKESINAGYIPQGAKVFEFKDRNIQSSRAQSSVPVSNEKFTSYIKYGRILWLVFSVLIVTGILLYYRNRNRL
jgi:4'-phosphopantetheinyl transferase EntD